MKNKNLRKLGSNTAKGGFKNETIVVEKFNNWKKDGDAQSWLKIMGYDLKKIEKVEAVKIFGHKTDVQAKITIYMRDAIAAENLSVKLVSNKRGFNQIDKRWVDKYVEMWSIPKDVAKTLKLFTGEIKPTRKGLKDPRRLRFDEMEKNQREAAVCFFLQNKILIISDILKGRGPFSAGWMLVARKIPKGNQDWVLKSINHVLNHYGNGPVEVSPQGSLRIGRITMQRKGGDAGRSTANMLQFKMDPSELFDS